MNKNCEKNHST